MKKLLMLSLVFIYTQAQSQKISGQVFEKNTTNTLPGVNIRWANEKSGTVTDLEGKFELAKKPMNHQLILSSVGFESDTLMVHAEGFRKYYLATDQTQLSEVVIRSEATVLDRMNPIHTEIITSKALAKAACCNLSESFETNASVSVSFADAVTGAKQINMLGLSGNYIQTNTENIPSIRGLNTTFGLNFTPGTWVQSIDVAKGVGSVVSGFESMTGQINVELQKPDLADKLYLNTYLNSFGRGEINLNLAKKISEKWSMGVLTHASGQKTRIDHNDDGFLDLPLYEQLNGIVRWKYQSEKKMAQFGIKALNENRLGGENMFELSNLGSDKIYGFTNNTTRLEAFSKTARLFPKTPYRGLGFINNLVIHSTRAQFGLQKYNGQEKTWYSNLIYQDIFGNTNHQYKTGLSFLFDDYHETYGEMFHLIRTDVVPGAFFEYTFTIPEKFSLLVGQRLDKHNIWGYKYTPRLHGIIHTSKESQLRFNVGKGWRMANPIAENFGLLVSSRQVHVLETLRPEESWNLGSSFNQEFMIQGKKGNITLDAFRTVFTNQMVVDMEKSMMLEFYNLDGKSWANSFQVEGNFSPKERFDLKLAYRFFDVQSDYLTATKERVLLAKQFLNKNRILFNAAYALPYDKWKFDFTWQWNGKRIQSFVENHGTTTYATEAPAFSNINAQITRTFRKFDVYLGGENLNNFKQANPIVSSDDPFGKHFDAGMVWGPVVGRMIYSGLRLKLK